MSELDDLYQEIILDHNRRPRNFRALEDPTHTASGHNPMCGDELQVYLHVDGENTVREVTFQGEGCAISRASASLMTTTLKGLPLDQAKAEVSKALGLLTKSEEEPDLAAHGDLAALAGVRRFPARIKCATLGWHAFTAALEGEQSATTE